MTPVCETKKEELARLANELMSSQENVLKNVFYKLVPAQNCGDKVCDKFIGRYNKVYSVMLTDDEDGVSSIVLTWDIIDTKTNDITRFITSLIIIRKIYKQGAH